MTYIPLKVVFKTLDHGQVVGWIESQDDRYRDYDLKFRASNGWAIRSTSYPELEITEKTLWIRGNRRSHDHTLFLLHGSFAELDPDSQQRVRQEIEQAVEEFNKAMRPKKKVEVTRWALVFHDPDFDSQRGIILSFATEEEARQAMKHYDPGTTALVKLTGMYEVPA